MKLLNLIFASALASSDDVTCGSVLKLVNKAYTVRLHSHEVKITFKDGVIDRFEMSIYGS